MVFWVELSSVLVDISKVNRKAFHASSFFRIEIITRPARHGETSKQHGATCDH